MSQKILEVPILYYTKGSYHPKLTKEKMAWEGIKECHRIKREEWRKLDMAGRS